MNQDKIKNIINILIAIMVIVGIGMGIFFILGREDSVETDDGSSGGVSSTGDGTLESDYLDGISPETDQLINLLNTLQRISLDHSVVERSDFNALKDITVPIPSEPVGTSGPFNSL